MLTSSKQNPILMGFICKQMYIGLQFLSHLTLAGLVPITKNKIYSLDPWSMLGSSQDTVCELFSYLWSCHPQSECCFVPHCKIGNGPAVVVVLDASQKTQDWCQTDVLLSICLIKMAFIFQTYHCSRGREKVPHLRSRYDVTWHLRMMMNYGPYPNGQMPNPF